MDGDAIFLLMLFVHDSQIVHWKNHLKFPEDPKLTAEAKDLIYRLLCDVEHRLGTGGVGQIKVRVLDLREIYLFPSTGCYYQGSLQLFCIRLILGSRMLYGINSTRWRLHVNQKSMGS